MEGGVIFGTGDTDSIKPLNECMLGAMDCLRTSLLGLVNLWCRSALNKIENVMVIVPDIRAVQSFRF